MARISVTSATCLAIVGAMTLLSADPSSAASHLWRFSEFYSSPDRTIQFIEMKEIGGSDNETAISGHWYATNTYNLDHSELLGSDLEPPTANLNFLVGTESYAALPGVPQPDYVLPDGIIDPSGDTVVWWFYQTIEIPPGVMPSDGVMSITVDDPDLPTYTVGVNSPTNLAGDTGTVDLSIAVPAGRAWRVPLSLLLVGTGVLSIAYWRRAS
jgi:hypothetical protein